MNYAIFGAGCFWCVEAIFQQVNGVSKVIPGYCGGKTNNPTYNEVCSGTTGHVEVAKIVYDKNLVSLDHLLEVFWKTHDPTTLNRQGNDIGYHYRSIVLFNNTQEAEIINEYIVEANQRLYNNNIVTEVKEFTSFYIAEDYHQDYYEENFINYLMYKNGCGRVKTLKKIWN